MSDSAEFADWWQRVGRSYDPEGNVSWFDKRRDLAHAAFLAAMAISRNYVCNQECEPTTAVFKNGRKVIAKVNGEGEPYLDVVME